MREIGAELEVATLLESNIQRAAERLKVRSVLYDADSGKQLWSQSYDREMNDLFAIQTDVAENIAAALKVRLSQNERDNIQHNPTQNMKAYDLYLQGKEYYERRRKEDNEKAIVLFEEARKEDPTFALAYVGLADCYIERNVRFDEEAFWIDSAIDLCRKAIAVDGKQARAYTVLARAMISKSRPIEVREALAKARELAPNDIEANFWTAIELPFSSLDKYTLFLKCRSLDPNDPSIPYYLARVCLCWEDHQLRDKWLERAIHLESDEEKKRMMTGEKLVYQKNYGAALDKLQPLSPAFVAYGSYVEDLKWGCWEYLNQWAEVLQSVRSTNDIENEPWHLLHLILALNATQHENEAREKAKRLLALATETFTSNPDDRAAPYFLAFCYRFLGEKDQAYTYLRRIFPEIIGWLALGPNDYALKIFSQDSEMQELMADFEKANQEKRIQIRQLKNDL
jgi:tetratricopeptide (TPR) repeat protein